MCLGAARKQRWLAHGAEVGFGVGANVGESGRIRHTSGLAGFGVGPALAFLELHGVIVKELVDGDRGQNKRVASDEGRVASTFLRLRIACSR
jgi:hypothetical protein